DNFSQVEALINAVGNRKEELLNELFDNNKLSNIIEEISRATVDNFSQVEALINAVGNRKEKLISQINFALLNTQVNEWQITALIQTSNLVSALDSEAVRILLPFSEEKFLVLSHQIKEHHIRAFTVIVSKLPVAEQSSIIIKTPWLALLNNAPRSHHVHLNNITRIAQFYLQSKSSIPNAEMKKPLLEYLRNNCEDIKKMINNTQCNNYYAFYDFILLLAGIDKGEAAGILAKSINGFCNRFNIFSQVSTYVSRLMYLFYAIKPDIAFKIICHENVQTVLKIFFCSDRIHENPEGSKALIKAVRNSNKKVWEEQFLNDKKITLNLSSYDLPALYREQDEERKQMGTLGLDYFKISAADGIENGI
ncbi:MAG: hypothetical protein AABZ32_01375, partial [Bacteroidota bacterium]